MPQEQRPIFGGVDERGIPERRWRVVCPIELANLWIKQQGIRTKVGIGRAVCGGAAGDIRHRDIAIPSGLQQMMEAGPGMNAVAYPPVCEHVGDDGGSKVGASFRQAGDDRDQLPIWQRMCSRPFGEDGLAQRFRRRLRTRFIQVEKSRIGQPDPDFGGKHGFWQRGS